MIFTKVPYAANFSFANSFDAHQSLLKIGDRSFGATLTHYEGEISRLRITSEDTWPIDANILALVPPAEAQSGPVTVTPAGQIAIRTSECKDTLVSAQGIGVCAKQAIFCFEYSKKMKCYGLGEKSFGRIEVSDVRTRFWNTDVLSDFHYKQWEDGPADPSYLTVPYLIIRQGDAYIGLLYHNPYPTWIDTGTDPSFFGTEDQNRRIIIGSEDGIPDLWVIVGPTLAELTIKLQKLVGTTPRPPLWALGYHQCRWEYEGEIHLNELDKGMQAHKLLNDGLWLDIDYKIGYRVFSVNEELFPSGIKNFLTKLSHSRRKVVPILDPGVKLDPNYEVYQTGLKGHHFCLGPEGKPFVGFVWPGETVFPDFSQAKTRDWWADYAREFRLTGFGGAWLDMNDPATGAVDPYAMLFHAGKWPHTAFRNQYALGMQMATRQGFLAAVPNERPFLLSRSGYIGTSQFAAIWTGDNVSNRWYLKTCIPTSLGLSLSGIPFNGPDLGGFIGDTTPDLMIDWIKTGFLFPFFRNHSVKGSRRQEPWALGKDALKVFRHYDELRYRLLPYLYQLFIEQEAVGAPILRPPAYEFANAALSNDEYMIGPSIFQAPILGKDDQERTLRLPGLGFWFDASSGAWLRAGRHRAYREELSTPLYVRSGAILPCQRNVGNGQECDLRKVDFHIFLHGGATSTDYTFDDGQSLDYRKGKQSHVRVNARISSNKLSIEIESLSDGYGECDANFLVYGFDGAIYLNGRRVATRPIKVHWTGEKPISARRVGGKA